MSQPLPSPAPPRWRALIARYETPLWIAAMVLLLAFRWPVIKGYYYKATGSVAPATTIPWRTDIDAALVEARRDGRRVVVDFAADWCPPCIAMQHDVWPDARVAQAIRDGFVPVMIDTDRDGATSTRFAVESIPTVVVLDAAGTELARGAPLTTGAMLSFLGATR